MVNESMSIKYLGGKDITIMINCIGVARHLYCDQMEFGLTGLIRLFRKLPDCPVEPSRVSLVHHHAGNFSEFAEFLRSDIEVGATADEVTFAAPIANIPVVSADPYLNKLLIANCEEALSRRPTERGPFRAVVENAIVSLLPHGNARASEIASQCGFSQRTFFPSLISQSLTFSKLLTTLP